MVKMNREDLWDLINNQVCMKYQLDAEKVEVVVVNELGVIEYRHPNGVLKVKKITLPFTRDYYDDYYKNDDFYKTLRIWDEIERRTIGHVLARIEFEDGSSLEVVDYFDYIVSRWKG